MELLHGDGTPWCRLPELPQSRYYHTQTGLEACGGRNNSANFFTCVRLEAGSWTPSHQLAEERRYHSSWASPAGTLLMGGILSPQTTELLDTATGDSIPIFPLKYDTQ